MIFRTAFFILEANMAHRKLFENVYFIPGFTNVGVINAPSGKKNHIYLIDTGTDRHYAEEILKELFAGIYPQHV